MARAPADHLSAAQAAERLGVSRRTLYAYVSRGLLTSEPGAGPGRDRRYPRESVEALRERRERRRDRGLAAHGALSWGPPVLDSALTLIEDGRPYYRGEDAIRLSREATFEAVAALLWTGDAGRAEGLFGVAPPSVRRPAAAAPLATRLSAHLLASGDLALASLGSPGPARLRAAADALAGLFGAAGARGPGRLAERLARGWRVERAADLEAALILSADHELNVSSFTARCVASADAKLEHVLLAALCALRGRRHGGLLERVEALLDDAGRDGAARAVERALADGGALPGFGHPLYPAGDPRGAELVRRAGIGPAAPGAAAEVLALARERLDLRPTLDFGLAALARELRLPAGAGFGLFALGRAAGWVAHAFEAWDDGVLIRPRSRYTGPAPGPAPEAPG